MDKEKGLCKWKKRGSLWRGKKNEGKGFEMNGGLGRQPIREQGKRWV